MDQYDIIIIGGGVVGCMIARELSRYSPKVLLIEKASDVGCGTSAANSALIHAGYDPLPGTIKAALNVAGNRMWDSLASELDFDFTRCGDYVVAIGDEELPALDRLKSQGGQNGVSGLKTFSAEEVRKRIPRINPEVSGALFAESAGICDTFAVTIAAAENALHNGVEIRLNTEFKGFIIEKNVIRGIHTDRGDFGCQWVINAAGLYADEVMHQANCRLDFKITPRRGEYCILDPDLFRIDTVIFPVPSEKGKGVLVFNTTHGNTVVGPTSEFVSDKEDKSISPEGLNDLLKNVRKLIPSVDLRWTIATFAGLRATGNAPCPDPAIHYDSDFIVESAQEIHGLINCAGIESPGLTASPAIALRVTELLKEKGVRLTPNPKWDPIRKRRPSPKHLSESERQKLIEADNRYGRIICRCEGITEGEIVAEIHAPIPARTYDAIKRRTWTGTGRCQGGFDMSRVVNILARELKVSPLEVRKNDPGSEFLFRESKAIGGTL